jgi:predicted enzyme related to lactoylglutathione lyase
MAAKKKKAAKKSAKKAPKKATARKSAPKKKAAPAGPQIVHWEIQTTDPGRAQGFYGEVFGWKIDANNPMNYGMVSSGGKDGIDGGIGGTQDSANRLVVYADVKDINATLAKIESLGGRTVMPRTDIGPVIMALYIDLDGNTMGLIEG